MEGGWEDENRYAARLDFIEMPFFFFCNSFNLNLKKKKKLLSPSLPSLSLNRFKKELKKRKIPESDYVDSDECGLRIYEVRGGEAGSSSSSSVEAGDTVTVHFDVLYRGLDVASSRSARLLGANRTIAEPYSFVAGGPVGALSPRRPAGEGGGGGLFSGAGGPEPPPALSTAVLGMRAGGVRSALVPPEKGYGQKGLGEIPAGASFELRVEVLDVKKKGK